MSSSIMTFDSNYFQAKSKWVMATESDNSPDPNTIATYLADPIIKSSAVKEAGGVMKY